MTNERIEKIITEVLWRLLPKLGANGSRGTIIVVFTGATVGSGETLRQLRGLILEGFELRLVFSEMADHLYGSWFREQLAGFPQWSQLPAFNWLRALREARAVVVPLLSVNTLSKLSLLIADSQTGNLILHGLFTGKPVIVASNGVEADQPGRAELGFDKGLPTLKRVVAERLLTIASYGCKVVDISQLGAATGVALPRTEAQETHRSADAVAHAAAVRKVVKHEAVLITAGDVLAAHSQGADLQCAARTLVTPLARDLAAKHGVGIVRDEG
jgi:S-ribosylhomocysteine lyase LuxS involved in autoinducer biosynthesis